MLEMRHLRTLAALRAAGSLVRAAELLNLTQSALSHQVRLMEDRYGMPLFERKSWPIAFTAGGALLLELADAVLPRVAQTERDVARLSQGEAATLRVALECHTCFDWLMPVLDVFRQRWPDVEVDLVSGLHGEPAELLRTGAADLVIGADYRPTCAAFPLFRYEIVLVLPHRHRLAGLRRVQAADLAGETLITYPVPPARVDLIRAVLEPAGVACERRTADLTAAILQLVASRRGVAALPSWAVKQYVDGAYVQSRPLLDEGLWCDLFVCVPPARAGQAHVLDFVQVVREQCARRLDAIRLL